MTPHPVDSNASRVLHAVLLSIAAVGTGLSCPQQAGAAVVASSESVLLGTAFADYQPDAASSSVSSTRFNSAANSSAGPSNTVLGTYGELIGRAGVWAETGSPGGITGARTFVSYADTWHCVSDCGQGPAQGPDSVFFGLSEHGTFRWQPNAPLFHTRLTYTIDTPGNDYVLDFILQSDGALTATASVDEFNAAGGRVGSTAVNVNITEIAFQRYSFSFDALISTLAYQTIAEQLVIESNVDAGAGGYFIDASHSFHAAPESLDVSYASDSGRTVDAENGPPPGSVAEPASALLLASSLLALAAARQGRPVARS